MKFHKGFHRALWPFVVLVTCFGCSTKKQKKIKVYRESVASCEARLVDVPFPLGICPEDIDLQSQESSKAQSVVEYKTTLSKEQLGEFYRLETERLGWKESFILEAVDESLFLFEKPFKYCIVSIRAYKKNWSKVRCFISAK